MTREKHTVAPVARRHHAIHHIDATVYRLKDIGRSANAHKVAGFVGRKNLIDHLNHVIHDFSRFTHGQTTYRVAVRAEFADKFCRLAAQIRIGDPLNNREICL